MAVSAKAALAGQGGIAMGNVIGSNIFNVVVILGITAMICPLAVQLKIVRTDMPLMLATSLILLPLMRTGFRLVRWEGAVLLLCYGLYLWLRWPA